MRSFLLLAILCLTTLPVFSAQGATVPQITDGAGRELDRQLAGGGGAGAGAGAGVSLMFATPVNVDNLEESNSLARQVQEELSRWFVQAGYEVQEIRKGADILFDPATGEMVLTRRADMVGTQAPASSAVVAGTYTITPRNVRFNLRVISTANQQVLGMSNFTIPITGEVRALLGTSGNPSGALIEPSVITTLP